MTLALLLLICMMWVPVGMFFLGKGEAKSTGFVTAIVGSVVVVGGILQAAIFADPFTAGLLLVFGVLYLQTAHALLTGLEDMRTVGNGALVVAIVCAAYAYLFLTGGGLKADGTTMIGITPYLGFMNITFVVICLTVVGVTYGKLSAKLAAWMFITLSFTCLFVPAIGLLGFGALPF
ncbi:MAG TPA: AmiS/UreI family transporter [Geopsychrobacteraceae bacterium]